MHIHHAIPPPSHIRHARLYPDDTDWASAHEAELDELEAQIAIIWLSPEQTRPKSRPIALAMTYKYGRNQDCAITKHKARCAIRGDTMHPDVPYDPAHTALCAVDKYTI